ncbi:hypothetical protein JCM10449v2_006479 [Rhodotorula kratochvilovae]
MSARPRVPRKSASSTLSYADPHASSSDLEDGEEGASGGGAARGSKGRGPSKRAKGKAKAVDRDNDEESDEDEAPRKKARNGRKGAAKGRKKGEGKLEALKTLPVELLDEIFSHLDPNNLLALSMVNKQYRALLVAKSSARLWKDARERLDLPDATAGGFTEWQYAQLMFSKHCQECGAANVRRADFGVRKRLCKTCSNAMIIRLDWSKNTPSSIHPLAKDCLLQALHSPNDLRWLAHAPYGLAADLQYYSDKLWELEYAEDDSSDEDEADEEDAARASTASAMSSRGRPTRSTRTVARSAYKEVSSDDDADKPGTLRRVQAFVKARQPVREQFKEKSLAMRVGALVLRQKLREREQRQTRWSFEKWTKQMQRAADIKERVIVLDVGYTEDDFPDAYYKDKLIAHDGTLTVEVLKLMARLGKRRKKADRLANLQARQRALRPRYDKLKKAVPATAQPFVPLFIDFLVLPSVRPLWEEEGKVTDAVWYAHLDAVKADLEQFRVDLVLHAREVVLAATTDPDDDDDAKQEADDDDLDAFFARATSFVCCAFRNCDKIRSYDARGRRVRHDCADAVGPLGAVLAHQHTSHNFASQLTSAKDLRGEAAPQMCVGLPLEVACAMGGVLDVLELDAETAGAKELEGGVKGVRTLEWENATTFKRFFDSWKSLLFHIKTQAEKAQRARPPLALAPPVVVAHCGGAYEWTPSPARDDSDSDGGAERQRRSVASSDESSDAEEGSDVVKEEEEESDPGGFTARRPRAVLDSEEEAEDDDD